MQETCFLPAIGRWFQGEFGTPSEPQRRGWPIIQSGAHALIAAPTGSGKTLAAFLACLDSLFGEGLSGKLQDETQILYVSPLKALSNDIHKNLEQPLTAIREALRSLRAAMWISVPPCEPGIPRRRSDRRFCESLRTLW